MPRFRSRWRPGLPDLCPLSGLLCPRLPPLLLWLLSSLPLLLLLLLSEEVSCLRGGGRMTSSSFGRDTVRTLAPGWTLSILAGVISPASASSASGSLSCESLSCSQKSSSSGYFYHHTAQACTCQQKPVLPPCLIRTLALTQA